MSKKSLFYLTKIGIIALAYFLLGKLGISLAIINGLVSSIWPASGLALGVLLIYGNRVWPGIWLGATLINLAPGVPLWASVAQGTGNTLEALLGAYLLHRFVGLPSYFNRSYDVFKFSVLAGLVSPLVSASTGVGSLLLSGVIRPADFLFYWFAWWLSEATGVLVITPFMLTWQKQSPSTWRALKIAEYALLLLMLAISSHLIFSGLLTGTVLNSLTYKYLLLPFYVWLIFRFGQRETATATLMVGIIGVWDTITKFDMSTSSLNNELILSIQAFISFILMGALILSAMVSERGRMIEDMARLEKLNLIGEMAAGIAHEIRNPMTTVRGFLQMLAGKEDALGQRDFYDLMISELDRANSIITEYLLLARNKPIELKRLNLNKTIEALAPLLVADAVNMDKEVEFFLGEVGDLYLDEKEVRQLLLNLSRNGLEAMSPGGKLTIRTWIEKNKLVLAVEDEGKGIPSDMLKKLGTPFLTTKENGTGLGLAVSYSIAARHKAGIKVESSPKGTKFFVRFQMDDYTGTQLQTSEIANAAS